MYSTLIPTTNNFCFNNNIILTLIKLIFLMLMNNNDHLYNDISATDASYPYQYYCIPLQIYCYN